MDCSAYCQVDCALRPYTSDKLNDAEYHISELIRDDRSDQGEEYTGGDQSLHRRCHYKDVGRSAVEMSA